MSEHLKNIRKRGARRPLTVSQQELCVKYMGLARALAKPYKLNWPTARDDFDSAAMLALVESAEAFDPDREVKFSTFARHRIWGALRDVQRGMVALGWRTRSANSPSVGSLSLDPERHGKVLMITDEGAPDQEMEAREAREEARRKVESLLSKLPRRHAAIVRELHLNGKTQVEASVTLGLCQSRLSYVYQEAISILDGSWAETVMEEVSHSLVA